VSDLTSSVFAQLNQSHIESIAGQLGIDPGRASDAIQQALPLLVGGLARNTTSTQGANALYSALERDHSNVDIGGLLGSVLGGGRGTNSPDLGGLIGSVLGGGGSGGMGGILESVLGGGSGASSSPMNGMGGAILRHIFGGRRDQAAQGLGKTTGLGGEGAMQLLAMLAPLVMSVLGQMTRKQGLDANGLSGVLGQENNRLQQSSVGGLLAGVLDRDGDGQVSLEEMMQAGAGLLGALGKR
jgi:hypothetical protein